MPGRDAREVIAERPFVAISGRPGSGKTTLVQAAMPRPNFGEGSRVLFVVPLILRDYQGARI